MRVIPFYYDDYDDLCANTYIVIDDSLNALVIDPSKDYNGISDYIKKNNLSLKGVLLTHGHFDHIRGVKRLIDKFHCPFYIGFEEETMLKDSYLNCSSLMGEELVLEDKPITISDGEILSILNEDIKCIHTPCHTSGSYCYLFNQSKILFSGDFLFKGSIGRTDLPTSDRREFPHSIEKIKSLNDEIKIYPGHGPITTLKEEKFHNPYLN